MSHVHVIDHPLVAHKLTIMREKDTSSKDFSELLDEISMLMAYEVTRDLPLTQVGIETPICKGEFPSLVNEEITIVPILRAGLGMFWGMKSLIPFARGGFIGLYRDPDTHLPIEYYCKMPDNVTESFVIIVDPMLATGGSAAATITSLKNMGCTSIRLMCLVAAPEGIKTVQDEHPDIDIYVAAVDECLNEDAYIVPGLGDAGDRIFGTK